MSRRRLWLALAFACVLPAGVSLRAEGGAAASSDKLVLDGQGFWRVHATLAPPMFGTAADAKPGELPARRAWWSRQTIGDPPQTPWPPADWASTDFDDSAWVRGRGPFYGGYGEELPSGLALLCLRGKFAVADPAGAGDLTLSLSYRGGVVVYLNGREVLRRNLPPGQLAPAALADDYPPEISCRPDGKPFGHYDLGKPEFKPLLDPRIRRVADATIPAALLRKGVNVLAIEIHRSAIAADKPVWTPCGFCSLQLRSTGGVVPNVARPAGVQAWNASPLLPVFDVDYGDPCERLAPIGLVGTRNGAFSGQVVVGSDAPIRGLRAKAGELRAAGGAAIPAEAVQVRYATDDGAGNTESEWCPGFDRGPSCFQALAETAPDEAPVRPRRTSYRYTGLPYSYGAVQPIWVTVNVPPDAAPGKYRGELTVEWEDANAHKPGARGAGLPEFSSPLRVPIELQVCPWKLPASRDFQTFIDMYQSPETLALRYPELVGPLWSDRHFALIDRTFRYTGQVGNKTLYVPLICKTGLGNAESMVRWLAAADASGGYEFDLSAVERYLDLAEQRQGRPEVLCLIVWDHFTTYGGAGGRFDRLAVSLLDRQSGQVRELEGPRYDAADAQVAFWQPLVERLRALAARRGLSEAVALGHANDHFAPDTVAEAWQRLWPGRPWLRHSHHLQWTFGKAKYPVRLASSVYRPGFGTDRSVKDRSGKAAARLFGWQPAAEGILVKNTRGITGRFGSIVPNRLVAEAVLQGGGRGRGALAADFFPVPAADAAGRPLAPSQWRPIAGRYPQTNWNYTGFHGTALAPGPAGAIATVTFEMIREGLQECEAKIFIEKALLDEKARGAIGPELADRCWRVLDERKRAILADMLMEGRARWLNELYAAGGWQERSEALFAAAAEVAEAVK